MFGHEKLGATVTLSLLPLLAVAPQVALGQEIPLIQAFTLQEPPENRPFFLRLGGGFVDYETSGRTSIMGAPLSNGKVAFATHPTVTFEGGWRFAPSWSASVLSGLPPTVSLHGEGALEPYGRLSKVTYGSVMLGVQYHPLQFGRFDPYIGGGVDYTFIWNTSGGSLPELNIDGSFGPILQGGFDIALTDKLSFYADVRKIWLDFRSKGLAPSPAGPLPVRVGVSPNPLLVTFGLSYRF